MHKNHGFLIGCAAVLLAAIVTLTGCPAEEESGPVTASAAAAAAKATLRYETVPYKPASRAAIDLGTLITSAYDDTQYYYVFLLGHINRVPLTYRDAVEYNGTTNVGIGFNRDQITEEAIGNSMQTADEFTVSTSSSENWTVEVEASFGGDMSPISGRVMAGFGGESTSGESTSRSTANTVETVMTATKGTSDTLTVTIGENGEPAGLYRYSLFGTTDVYYVVITDKSKKVKKGYRAYCARPQTYWGIDYEPDIAGNFGKTIPGELLVIPTIDNPSALPTPTSNNVQPIPPERAATPTASVKGGTYNDDITISLSCTDRSAKIYYTLDGGNPIAVDNNYNNFEYPGTRGQIVITAPTTMNTSRTVTLKAIAQDGYKELSNVMTETYTIKTPDYQREWRITNVSQGAGRNRRITDAGWITEDWNIKNATNFKDFESAKLQKYGYTELSIYFEFDAQEINDGWVDYIFADHNGNTWKQGQTDLPKSGWTNVNMTLYRSIADFDTNGSFKLRWDASGSNSDDYWLGSTVVTIKALTPEERE
ncbi:chitobiase/beta-hexosaminidase C-terminal domain-containing protein [Pillotina sp. SPG140]